MCGLALSFGRGKAGEQVSGNLLTIRAQKKGETEEKKGDYHYAEHHYGQFQRSVTLPAGVDAEKVEARARFALFLLA